MCTINGFALWGGGGASHRDFMKAYWVWGAYAAKNPDAAGIAWAEHGNAESFYYKKAPGRSHNLVGRVAVPPEGAITAIMHTRYATHGEPENNANNHPFVGEQFALIHNGIASDALDVAKNLPLAGECDSEAIAAIVEAIGDPLAAGRFCLQALRGRQAVAIIEKATGNLTLWCNEPGALYYAATMRGIWFATTREGVLRMATRRVKVQPFLGVETFHPSGETVAVEVKLSTHRKVKRVVYTGGRLTQTLSTQSRYVGPWE